MTRPLRGRLLLTLTGVAILSCLAPWVRGESSFFRVAPGPLSESHAELDNSDSCGKCHEPNQGVTNAKCLDCHKLLRDRIANKLGLHATFSGRCIQCHPGHKGRTTSIIDWQHVGGQQTFKHDLTAFPLTNQHAQLACTACHTKRMRSGRLSYLGLQPECQSCHRGVHRFSKPDLVKQCDSCHPAGKANKGMHLSEWSDQHYARTKLLLPGKHAEQPCSKCHPKGEMAGRVPPRACVDCHRPNHPTPAALADCTQCHKTGQPWKEANVDHRRFGFALLGKHAKLDCKRCHPRGLDPNYSDNGCANCHQHRDVHKRQFADKRCDACHIEGGKRTLPFDHNKDTRYALLGFHAEPAVRNKCASCHPQGIYRTDKLQCADCHQDKHKGQSGTECTKCHAVTQHWKDARYAMPHSKFALEGLHRKVKCQSCHPASKYQLGDVRCVDCHAKTDPHQGKLGSACEKCHVPARGAPKFDHERMTNFVRSGAHLKVDCAFCHQPRPERPPPVGWTRGTQPMQLDRKFPVMGKRCADCHQDPHKGAAGPDCRRCHGTSTFEVLSAEARLARPIDHDRGWLGKHTSLPFDDDELAAEGRACGRCHGAPTCDRCHRTSPPKSHTGGWRLRGHGIAAAFDPEGCRTCHLTGTCVACHRSTRPLNHRGAWSTLHGYAAGTFADNNCLVCHSSGECQSCHQRK